MENALVTREGAIQTIPTKLIAPYIRENAAIGIHGFSKQTIYPNNPPAVTDNEILFNWSVLPGQYIDLNTVSLYVKGKLKKTDGTDLVKGTAVVLANNSMHSLISDVYLYIGKNQLEIYTGNYPHKAYITQLFNDSDTHLNLSGFEYESKGATAIISQQERGSWTNESRTCEFYGKMLLPLFNTNGYLLPDVQVKMKLRLSDEKFYVITDATNKDTSFKFNIEDIYMHVTYVKIDPSLTPDLKTLTELHPATFYFDNLICRQFTISKNTNMTFINKCFEGTLPSKIMICFYSQSQLSGAREESPTLTEDTNVKTIQLIMNGIVVREHIVDWTNSLYIQSYKEFLDFFRVKGNESKVSRNMFKTGYRMYCFNLFDNKYNDKCAKDTYEQSLFGGVMSLNITFNGNITKDLVCMVFAFSPDVLEVSHNMECRITQSIQ